jgi:hypothetical protein
MHKIVILGYIALSTVLVGHSNPQHTRMWRLVAYCIMPRKRAQSSLPVS